MIWGGKGEKNGKIVKKRYGRVGLDDGSWKETEACSSEEDALKWINTMFGVTE